MSVPDALSQSLMPQDVSPPSTPPSPSLDSKLSRKREREVSLEPVSTPKLDADVHRERRDARTPAKKNKTQLDPPEEALEDDSTRSRSNSNSPPLTLSTSPPNEMKIRVRQISQGVEDISWQNMNTVTSDKDIEADPASTAVAVEDIKDSDESSDGPADSEGKANDTILKSHELIFIKVANSAIVLEIAESESGDKSLKRKLSERGASQGPPDSTQLPPEPLKRLRDDDEKDQDPQETRKPSPPLEQKPPKSPRKAPATVNATPKLSGFMAYASSSSPFAAVKGQNLFASNKAASPPPAQQSTPAPPITIFGGSQLGDAPSSSSTPGVKRSGFEAFASSSSPFASASRSKSPVLGSTSKLGRAKSPPRRGNSINSNAFSSYAGGLQSFVIPPPKRARAGTPSNGVEGNSGFGVFGSTDDGTRSDEGDEDDKDEGSFSAKLRAGKDDDEGVHVEQENIYNLTEQDVLTGEEDEQTIHQVRGKLFSLVDGNQWKERGTGLLKLNVKRSDGSGARLVMRKEAVYTLLLNVTLFPGMRCSLAQDPRYLRLSVIENGETTHYNLRLANAKIANELLEEIIANIPA
ncbi:hypothetical protein C0995_014952 [Termitomyces sp. Mi166|nr:hypothetical protein C0995_014952 [Termitomyces sp. Mi166\